MLAEKNFLGPAIRLSSFKNFLLLRIYMERIHLIISGDVIGVGFRAWTLRQAQGKHLTGWVTNRQDNAVEIVAEGNKLDLTNFAARCRRGPELAVVKSVDLRWENSTSEFVSFDVLY